MVTKAGPVFGAGGTTTDVSGGAGGRTEVLFGADVSCFDVDRTTTIGSGTVDAVVADAREPWHLPRPLPSRRDPLKYCLHAVPPHELHFFNEAGAAAGGAAGAAAVAITTTMGRDADAVGAVELESTAATHGRYSMHITVGPRKTRHRGVI